MNPSSLQFLTWTTVLGAVVSALALAVSEPVSPDHSTVPGRAGEGATQEAGTSAR